MIKRQTWQWDAMTMGVCYYPEHWEQRLWESDLDRMLDTGITVVRVGEFAWNKVEPAEGVFDFSFFDGFLSLCERKGMRVIFGTPTATPPVWLTEKYPEVLNAKQDGTLLRHGGRRHYNYNSKVYRKLSARIVEQEAAHYGKNPAIIGWQIDNELNCETNEFYSEADTEAFRAFLQEKYQTIDALNEAWGTVFWNETYDDWAQIYVPRTILNEGYNPGQKLDYIRFISESALSFCRMQAEIIRKYRKDGDFITTNGMFGRMDNHRMERESLDIYHYDSYPNFAFSVDRDVRAAKDLNDRKWSKHLTQVRSICPHFGIMEQQSGANGWVSRMEASAPRPGQLALWAMQSVAHGADYISFFRWRTCAFGTEQYWHGILDYDNRDNRKLDEVKSFYRKLKALDELCGAEHAAAFGILQDYDNEWDTEVDVWHRRVAWASDEELFVAAQLMHAPYDVVCLEEDTAPDDLSAYPVLFYPHPVLMDEARAALLKAYVENGGTLIVGCRAGYKDMSGRAPMEPQPGLLRALTGTNVRDFTFASPAEEEIRARFAEDMDAAADRSFPMPVFNDVLEAEEGTDVLAVYENGYFAGSPAVTQKRTGAGRTIHFGSTFSRENLRPLFAYLHLAEPFADLIDAPAELEIVVRKKDGKRWLFVLNYQPEKIGFTLRQRGINLFTGAEVSGAQTLPAYGTGVYRIA